MEDYLQMRAERIRRSKRKRKRQRQLRIYSLILGIVILSVLLVPYLYQRNIRLKEAEAVLSGKDTPENGVWDKTEKRTEDGHKDEEQPVSSVDSIEEIEVDQPVRRTRQEVLLRLEELGKDSPVIKEISDNSFLYPEDMLKALANNPEMAGFVAGYLDRADGLPKGLAETEKEAEFPLFLQWDLRWGYQEYGDGSTVGVAGCGPTCLSMVLFYLTGNESLTPDVIAEYSMENGYYVQGTGTAWALMEDVCWLYGVRSRKADISETEIKYALDQGGAVICSMSPGDFTDTGHFIVIYGYDREGFFVNDPNCVSRSRKKWTWQVLKSQIKSVWTYTV